MRCTKTFVLFQFSPNEMREHEHKPYSLFRRGYA